MLDAAQPVAYEIRGQGAASPFVLICDHASRRIPAALGTLGVAEAERRTHIAWDIGAAEVTRGLAHALDATCVLQNYSRLVIDCNRPPTATDSIPRESGGIRIAGNARLTAEDAAARRAAIFDPYHAAVTRILDERQGRGQQSVLIAVHSFTPSYPGQLRPWQVGLLYNRDRRLAHALLVLLRTDASLCVGDNEPYQMSDLTDYSLPQHGEQRGILHVGLEIRQDLLTDIPGQQAWVHRLTALLPRALAAVS